MKFLSTKKYFVGLYFILLFFFFNAFKIFYFQDDFFFLRISRISKITEFFKFFSPLKIYFYRPLSSEVFYFFSHAFHNSVFFAHTITFILYGVGIYFLYKVLTAVTKNTTLSGLVVFFYAIHLTHVFQLYYIGTAQEIFAFTFLTVSFYFFLQKKYILSLVLFSCALLSKESSILFPIFLILAAFFHIPNSGTHDKKIYVGYIVLALIAVLLYRPGSAYVVSTEQTYLFQLNPKLIANNIFWYSAWALGFPNFLPDYFTSIFSAPLPKLWEYFSPIQARLYGITLLTYIALLGALLVYMRSRIKKIHVQCAIFLLVCFLLFVSPTLFIIHKWMVRLTIPLIFVSVVQAYIVYVALQNKKTRALAVAVVALYSVWNYFGIKVHETTSTYVYETVISKNVAVFMQTHRREVSKYQTIYFKDPFDTPTAWGWSKKLETTLHGSDFLDFYFPAQNKKALFGYKDKNVSGSYVVDATQFLP